MKKLVLTATILLGFAMGSFAQGFIYQDPNTGLFRRGKYTDDERIISYNWMLNYGLMSRDGGTFSLCLPGHNFTTNWNGGSQGHDDDLIVPLGNGALLLIGFGAAYAMTKRKKKD
jgi:hypothetical protein